MGSRAWAVTCLLLAGIGSSGCVLGGDTDRPVLGVDLLWDTAPGDAFAAADGCEEAGVETISYELTDGKGRVRGKSDGLEKCAQLDFISLTPGKYSLDIHGYDSHQQERWGATCDELELTRFDALYNCQVDLNDSGDDQGADAGTAEDAGVAD